jgi:hypothetical protein
MRRGKIGRSQPKSTSSWREWMQKMATLLVRAVPFLQCPLLSEQTEDDPKRISRHSYLLIAGMLTIG